MLHATSRCLQGPVLRCQAKSIPARLLSTRMFSTRKNVLPKEAYELVNTGEATYLDVRTVEEVVSTGSAPNAVVVPIFTGPSMSPNPKFLEEVRRLLPDASKPLVVGCKAGRRSLVAIDALAHIGYSNLTNVDGGFDLWRANELPAEAAKLPQ